MDRVLVTGGTGFIGRAALPALARSATEVHVVARTKPSINGLPPGVRLHRAELLDPLAAAEVIARVRPTHLLHLAWYIEPGQVWSAPENRRWVDASARLADAFVRAGGARLVFGGSVSQYGHPTGPALAETDPLRPVDLYGSCKAQAEERVLAACASAGVSAAAARIFFAFGPHEDPRRLVASVAASLLRGRRARCSHGRQRRDYLYSPDVGAALATLLESAVEGPVNIASGEALELRELVGQVADAAGSRDLVEFGAIDPGPNEAPELRGAIGRLGHEVGWSPAHDRARAIDLTVDWWRTALGG